MLKHWCLTLTTSGYLKKLSLGDIKKKIVYTTRHSQIRHEDIIWVYDSKKKKKNSALDKQNLTYIKQYH